MEQKGETGSTNPAAKIRPRAARFINQPHVFDIGLLAFGFLLLLGSGFKLIALI